MSHSLPKDAIVPDKRFATLLTLPSYLQSSYRASLAIPPPVKAAETHAPQHRPSVAPDPRDQEAAFAPALTQNKPFARRHSAFYSSDTAHNAVSVCAVSSHSLMHFTCSKQRPLRRQVRMPSRRPSAWLAPKRSEYDDSVAIYSLSFEGRPGGFVRGDA